MLSKVMSGRLGNQMFQYASILSIQKRLYPDEKINLAFFDIERDGKKSDGFYNQLNIFQLNIENVTFDQPLNLTIKQKLLVLSYFIKRKIIKLLSTTQDYEWKKREFELRQQKKYNANGLYIFSYGYYDFKKSRNNVKNKLFLGFYETAKYFDNIREVLLKEFTPKFPPLPKNRELYEAIHNSESICVSIRRGDFLNTKLKNSNYICTPTFFREAIKAAQKTVKNPRFIVFSDDITWVKSNLNFPKNTLYETGDDPVWEKLRLMYSCKHFIISNSTFSWWAQYLSRNNDKIVIAPSRWRKIGYDGRELYNQDWILIDA